jgi:hypothetical protein
MWFLIAYDSIIFNNIFTCLEMVTALHKIVQK